MKAPSDRSFTSAPFPVDREPAPEVESTLELAATLYTQEQLAAIPGGSQIALAGRSNVGKSSLINALARRRQLARISSTPGKTRSINLFRVLPEGFFLTDLPGYGYARRGKEERRLWGKLIEDYLCHTPDLKAVIVLLDCRLPPQAADLAMVDFARSRNLSLRAVLTKSDKCNQRERASRQKEWSLHLQGALPLTVSAKTGMGLRQLWAALRLAAGIRNKPAELSAAAGEKVRA